MTEHATEDQQSWPTHCEHCGTRLVQATIDFDPSNADRPEMRPGEMAALDFCPNEDCPSRRQDVPADEPSTPGSLGGDSGGG